MSTIKELWHGNICPQESRVFDTPVLKELHGYAARHRAELERELTDEQKELLGKMMDCRNEYDSLAETEIFAYGFKLGARLMLEMLTGADIKNNEKRTSRLTQRCGNVLFLFIPIPHISRAGAPRISPCAR